MKRAFHRNFPGHKAEDQRALTLAAVPAERDSFTQGCGFETVHTMIAGFRERGGPHELYLGIDIRVLGESMKDIRDAMHRLEAYKVRVIDLSHPEDDTALKLYDRAQSKMRWSGDKRQQGRKGAKGGTAKGIAAAARREESASREVIVRLCAHPKLTWKDCAAILGMSEATLIRNYRI